MRSSGRRRYSAVLCGVAVVAGIAGGFPSAAAADDQLLKEAVEFTGVVTFVAHKVPGLVIGAVRNGERAVSGFGKTSTGAGGATPDGKTILRIGSVTKVFAGAVLASMAAAGTVALANPLDTTFTPSDEQRARLMQGHDFGGEPLPDAPTGPVIVGSGGLYSTVNDILTWLEWHLDRFSAQDAEMRLVDHAVWLQRDGLSPVYGFDESGRMDALGLAWIVMMPQGDRPLILQKAGGLQGIFCYAAFAPSRGIGAFVAINQFDFGAAGAMTSAVNELIATLAPR
jgi:CubicO group peptidase (beta-lactamase class C family)